jgi:hypothetical protein
VSQCDQIDFRTRAHDQQVFDPVMLAFEQQESWNNFVLGAAIRNRKTVEKSRALRSGLHPIRQRRSGIGDCDGDDSGVGCGDLLG